MDNVGDYKPIKPRRGNPAWKKGMKKIPGSGGSPARKGETWREVIQAMADEAPGAGRKTRRQLVLEKAFGLALRGVPWAIQFLVERCEGKAPQAIFVANAPTNPLRNIPDGVLERVVAQVEANFLQSDKDASSKGEGDADA